MSEDQVSAMKEFGARIKSTFGKTLGETTILRMDSKMDLSVDVPCDVEYVEIMEDQTESERVCGWELELLVLRTEQDVRSLHRICVLGEVHSSGPHHGYSGRAQ